LKVSFQRELDVFVEKLLFVCLRLCDPIDVLDKNDVSNLYGSLAGNFAGVAQYNGDNRQFEGVTSGLTVDLLCAIMVNESLGTPVKRYSLINNKILEEYSKACLDYKYDKMVTDLGQSDWRCEAAESGGNILFSHCTDFLMVALLSDRQKDWNLESAIIMLLPSTGALLNDVIYLLVIV
jgi:hypothetical protein